MAQPAYIGRGQGAATTLHERAFLATAGGKAAEASLRELFRHGADMGGVLGLAAAEGVVANVARLLRGVGGLVLDDATRVALLELERAPEFRMRFLGQRLEETLRVLDGAGFDVLVAGRAALGFTSYRSWADMAIEEIELAIKPEQDVVKVVEAVRVLTERAAWKLEGANALADTRAPALGVKLRLRDDLDDLWSRAEHRAGLPPRARVPARLDRLIAAAGQPPGWRAVRDVAVILAEGPFDWTALTDRRCYATLRLARERADQDVPEDVLARLRPAWWRRVFTGAGGRARR